MIDPRIARRPNARVFSLFAMLAVLILPACQPRVTDLSFETVALSELSNYGAKEPDLVVIAQPAEVDALNGWVEPDVLARVRAIDYGTSIVIGVFQGWKPTTRYGVQIERITRRGDVITVHALFTERKPGTGAADAETSPYHLVRLPKTGVWRKAITFNLVSDDELATSLSHDIP